MNLRHEVELIKYSRLMGLMVLTPGGPYTLTIKFSRTPLIFATVTNFVTRKYQLPILYYCNIVKSHNNRG